MPIRPQPNRTVGSFRWRLFPAVAIVALGVLFLLNNLGYPLDFLDHGNWWAIFILCAALAPLTRAYEVYRAHGHFDAEVAYCTLCGATVAVVGVVFLAGLDWTVWWPLFVIIGGLYTLVRRPCGYGRHYWRHCWYDDRTPANHADAPAKQ